MRFLPKSPYPLGEFISMARRRFSEPPPFLQNAEKKLVFNDQKFNEATIGFVGDICPLRERDAVFESEIFQFFENCDLMVGNFEGVITDEPQRPFLLKHTPAIFDVLELFKPLTDWTLTIANNHAMDYGDEALDRTIKEFDSRGINWLGTAYKPSTTLIEGVTGTSWSWWMNGKTERIYEQDPGVPKEPGLHIALPHWGYEHERDPRQDQRDNIPQGYGMVVGHHSHLPQPLEMVDEKLPVAWSLGNFLTAKTLAVLGEGALLKVVINRPDNKILEIQSIDYRTILLDRDNPNACRVYFR